MTPEQVSQWARETKLITRVEFNYEDYRLLKQLVKFATLARADLEKENARLKKQSDVVAKACLDAEAEVESLKANLEKALEESKDETHRAIQHQFVLVEKVNALKAEVESLQTELNEKRESIALTLQEVESLRADAARYQHAKLYDLLGGFTDEAIDRDICIHNAAMKGTP